MQHISIDQCRHLHLQKAGRGDTNVHIVCFLAQVAYQSWGELKNYPDIKAMTPKARLSL